jgi:hypothetical protein
MKHTLILLALMNVAAFAAERIPLPTAHTIRNIEGWTVRVDDRLLHGDGAAAGERALKLIGAHTPSRPILEPASGGPVAANLRGERFGTGQTPVRRGWRSPAC